MSKDDRVIYSSGPGIQPSRCPRCAKPPRRCRCAAKLAAKASSAADQGGVVRVRREVKGRGGKTVTTVSGIPGEDRDLRAIAKRLKQSCGSGGAVKAGVIEIQGDHREKLIEALRAEGYDAKLAGG